MWNSNSKSGEVQKETNDLFGDKNNKIEGDNANTDSGFMSGLQSSSCFSSESFIEEESHQQQQQPQSVNEDEKLTNIVRNINNIRLETPVAPDSGLIEDIDEDDLPKTTNNSSSMLLDRNIDTSISEWLCDLKLSAEPINNLTKVSNQTPLWQMYYEQNDDGDTQLHVAVIHGITKAIGPLIKLAPHPCLLDIQNDLSQSALHLAVLTSQPSIVSKLVLAGATTSVRDRNGNTALHLACQNGDLQCVKEILTKPETHLQFTQQDLEQWNYDGEKCVHIAAQGNHIEILRHLVKYGADINAREGKTGRTLLHFAIEENNEKLVNFLFDECPQISLETETYSGLTAYQLASLTHNQLLIEDLKRRGAEPISPPDSEIDDDESDMEDYQITTSHYDNFSLMHTSNPINVS